MSYATESVALAVYPLLFCQVKRVSKPAYSQSLCFVQLIVRLVRSYFTTSFRSVVSFSQGSVAFCIGWDGQESVKCRPLPFPGRGLASRNKIRRTQPNRAKHRQVLRTCRHFFHQKRPLRQRLQLRIIVAPRPFLAFARPMLCANFRRHRSHRLS